MAAYGPAVNRIKYLITGEHQLPSSPWLKDNGTKSPATISGGPDAIYSYRLKIAWKFGENNWTVRPSDSTPTTNRHIQAVRFALEELGYHCSVEPPHTRHDQFTNWYMVAA
jgi:hypothetical protein